ncbi:MAG: S8 family serine peptidase, partial [Alphaproteobacteria bacterium]|nr:S8 family serine peptidase [Alphaproteobacteria bacterium]
SLSIGPALPIEDEEVHIWTSALDAHLWSAGTVLTSACGNSGEDDWVSGNARVQPSSDGVNAIGVGAATTRNPTWIRAPYSSIGPGRSPGFIKPDLVAFGGCDAEPFWLLDARKPGFSAGRMGTSYAAPYAARSGIGIRAHFGGQLSAAAIKALMVHHSERQDQEVREVGWGRMPSEVSDLVVCPDGEVTIVYQGTLEPSQYVRFMVPVPRDPFKHPVSVRATFCIFTPVDPEDSMNYTRAGLGIVFRPTTTGSPGKYRDGKARSVHESASFFSAKDYYPTEMTLRKDAHKWETIVRKECEFDPGELDQPVFDIEHHSRAHGQSAARRTDISYALIVTLSSRQEPDLYNRILAAYPNVLEIMNPAIEVQVKR